MRINDLKKYGGTPIKLKPNYRMIPVYTFDVTEEGAKEYSEIYRMMLKKKGYSKIKRTPSGGISYYTIAPAWDIQNPVGKNFSEMTIITEENMYRLRFQHQDLMNDNEENLYGAQCHLKLKKILAKAGIKIEDYYIDNGKELNATIGKAPIYVVNNNDCDKTWLHVHHIDFHNSYPAGLVNTHPEFRPVIEKLYNERKIHPENKQVLNKTIGFWHGYRFGFKLANLAKDAIEDNNSRVLNLAKKVERRGGVILMYNTDGFWYISDKPYHGQGEGKALGQWENDYVDCKFRMKSCGAYEFICNGEYIVKYRGIKREITSKLKNWGDIYTLNEDDYKFVFIENVGIIPKKKYIEMIEGK